MIVTIVKTWTPRPSGYEDDSGWRVHEGVIKESRYVIAKTMKMDKRLFLKYRKLQEEYEKMQDIVENTLVWPIR